MQRSDFLIKLISVILFIAILLYIGLSALSSLTSTLQTVTAVSAEFERSCSASGWAVRRETVIGGTGGSVYVAAEEGKRISKGGEIAVEYSDSEAIKIASELTGLKLRKQQLEHLLDGDTSSSEAFSTIIDLSSIVRGGDYTSLAEAEFAVDTTVRSHSEASDRAELETITKRIDRIEAQYMSGSKSMYSPMSGIFSSAVDGLEYITPEIITGRSASELESLFAAPDSVSDTTIGKLITDITWYYAAVISETDAETLRKIASSDSGALDSTVPITVKFTKPYKATVDMFVKSISEPDSGRCSVIFFAQHGLEDAVGQRELSAEIIFDSIRGLRIPAETLHEEDGKSIVYIVTGLQAEAVEVEVIGGYDDYIFVRDGADTGSNLRRGSTVIVKATDLEDGKVVRK